MRPPSWRSPLWKTPWHHRIVGTGASLGNTSERKWGRSYNEGLPRTAPRTPRGPTEPLNQRPFTARSIPLSPRTARNARLPSHLHVPEELEDLHGAVHDVLHRLLPDSAERGRVHLPGGLLSLRSAEGPRRHPRRRQRRGGHSDAAAFGQRSLRVSVRGLAGRWAAAGLPDERSF